MYYVLAIAFFLIGFFIYSYVTLQVILSLFFSIPLTNELAKHCAVNKGAIFRHIGTTVVFCSVVTALMIYAVYDCKIPYIQIGFTLGFSAAFFMSLKKIRCADNMDDYMRNYCLYIDGDEYKRKFDNGEISDEDEAKINRFFGVKKPGYIRIRTFVIVIVIILAVVCVGGWYAYRTYESKLEETKKLLQTETDNYMETLSAKNEILNEKQSMQNELNFWQMGAVICTPEGKKYHHYGCGHLDGRGVYIFNVEYAKSLGYTPCLDCCG